MLDERFMGISVIYRVCVCVSPMPRQSENYIKVFPLLYEYMDNGLLIVAIRLFERIKSRIGNYIFNIKIK